MKIGVIVEKFPSPSETFITAKVIALCKRGHEVVVFRNGNDHNEELETFYNLQSLENLSIVNLQVNLFSASIQHPLTLLTAIKKSNRKSASALLKKRLFRKHRCDVYHFEFSGLGINYMSLFPSLNAKTMVSCRGTAEKVKPLTDAGRKADLQKLFSKVHRIHCVSNDMAATVQQYGASAEKVFINRPAIDIDIFSRSYDYVPHDHLSIISVGRFTFQKGYLVGLLAFREVVKTFPTIKWKIVGDGPCREEVIFYIYSMNLQSNVELLGRKNRDEIRELYENADVFFLPSVYEGIANVTLEAMSMQLPVVASRSGGMDEVIINNQNGMLCDVYEHSMMALQLKRLLSDFDLRKNIGTNARKTVEESFSLARLVNVFEKEYKELIGAI